MLLLAACNNYSVKARKTFKKMFLGTESYLTCQQARNIKKLLKNTGAY